MSQNLISSFDGDDGTQRIWYDMDSLADVTLDGASNAVGLRLINEVSKPVQFSLDNRKKINEIIQFINKRFS